MLLKTGGRRADRAHEIRDYYKSKGRVMETPDSIHLASAILYEAEVFYTFDGEGKKKRPTRAKLLSLSGDVAGHDLTIRRPYAHPNLLTGVPAEDVSNDPLASSSASQPRSGQSPDDEKV